MRCVPCLVLALLLAGCQADGPDAADGSETAPGLGALAGVVVDAAVMPIEGATVEASRPTTEPLQAGTDAGGQFRFQDLEPGLYGLTIRAPGYIDVVTTATVVADVADPENVKVTMQEERSTQPYVRLIYWEGILGCGTSGSNLCSAPEQATGQDIIPEDSARLFYDEVVDERRVPEYIQAEVLWDPNIAAFDHLNLLLGSSTPPSWEQFEYERRYDTFIGSSPIVGHLNKTILEEDQIGVERGLVLELYGGGYDPDNAGAAVDQEFEAFIHLFYYSTPPEGWQFSSSGPPP